MGIIISIAQWRRASRAYISNFIPMSGPHNPIGISEVQPSTAAVFTTIPGTKKQLRRRSQSIQRNLSRVAHSPRDSPQKKNRRLVMEKSKDSHEPTTTKNFNTRKGAEVENLKFETVSMALARWHQPAVRMF